MSTATDPHLRASLLDWFDRITAILQEPTPRFPEVTVADDALAELATFRASLARHLTAVPPVMVHRTTFHLDTTDAPTEVQLAHLRSALCSATPGHTIRVVSEPTIRVPHPDTPG